MQQKVQFIAAIIHDPDLLILDEPFSGLDPVNAELLNRVIRELNEQGRTIIFSTHVLHQAEQLCDRIMLIDQGTKILDDTMEGIRTTFDPRTIEVEPARGASLPEAIRGVRNCTPTGEAAFELHLDDTADPNHVMQQVLTSCPVRSIKIRQLTLDEVFVSLVRDRAHETHTAFALDGATP